MRKFITIAFLAATLVPHFVEAQTKFIFETVNASNIKDQTGGLLSSGTFCFLGTDSSNNPVTYTPSGSAAVSAAVCGVVTNGTVGPLNIANPAYVTPANLNYRVTAVNSSSTTLLTIPNVLIQNAPIVFWNNFILPATTTATGLGPPNIACASGAAYSQSDSAIINPLWGCGTGSIWRPPSQPSSVFYQASAPTGACNSAQYLVYGWTGGGLYGCPPGGSWTQITGGGASGVASFSGDGTFSSNSGSTGGVTFTLANAAANTAWGNNTGSSAAPGYHTLTSYLDSAFSSTQGSILYRGASGWAALAPGTSGNVLQTQGTAANPIWAAGGGSMVYPGAGIANSTGSAWGTSYTTSGTGTVLCLTTSCTMVTPALGTPSALVLTNATGLPGGQLTGANSIPASTLPLATTGAFGAVKPDGSTITVSAGVISSTGGGIGYPGAGVPNSTGSSWGTSYTTSGTGSVLVLATSPTLVTPALGTPSALVLTNATGLPGGQITGATSIPPSTLPLATSSAFGAMKCGTGTTCTAGVVSVSAGGGVSTPTFTGPAFATASSGTLTAATPYTINCLTYSCVGDGSTDNYTPLTNAIAAACSAASGLNGTYKQIEVYIPPGNYDVSKPVHLNCSNVSIVSDPLASAYISPTYYAGPNFYVGPQTSAVPTTTALLTGGGSAMTLTSANAYYLNLSDTPTVSPWYLTASTAFTFEVPAIKFSTNTAGWIAGSSGNNGVTGIISSFGLQLNSSHEIQGNMRISGSNFNVTWTTPITTGTQYAIAMTFDGSNIRLFINGAVVATQAASGSLTQLYSEDVTIGGSISNWPEGSFNLSGVDAVLDSLRISNNVRYTSGGYTPSTAKLSPDANTLALLNFNGQFGIFTTANVDISGNGNLAYLFLRTVALDNAVNRADLHNLEFSSASSSNMGPVFVKAIKCHDTNITVDQGWEGAYFLNNSYWHDLTNYYVQNLGQNSSTPGKFAIAYSNAPNDDHLEDSNISGGVYEVAKYGGSVYFTNLNLNPNQNTITPVLDQGGGFGGLYIDYGNDDLENGSTAFQAGMIISAENVVRISNYNTQTPTNTPQYLFNDNTGVQIDAPLFVGSQTATNGFIEVTNTTSPITVIQPQEYSSGGVAISDTPQWVNVIGGYLNESDFSGMTHTLPAAKGLAASKPATCTQGEQYFATDATAGQNLYFCTATNTWTQQLNSGGGSTAFSALTGGTNTAAAMVVGTGSSLTTSGSGSNTATAVPASGITGTTLASGVTASSLTSFGSGILLGTPASGILTNATGLPLSGLVTQAANTVVMNATAGTAAPTAVAMPTCTTGADLYNTSTNSWSCVSTSGTSFVSNVTSQSTSQTSVTLASSPAAQAWNLTYYADQHTVCTTGTNSVTFTFSWTDATNARTLNTGSLTLGATQLTNGYLSGSIPIWVSGSTNVTYTSTVTGTCTTGTSAYDIHVKMS